ncbi:MAG: translation elongation factor Ts, partial [Bryobacteraceae bacterium]
MAEITAQLVKALRERTGAGMMECKSALVEANGDIAEAEVVLRKRGIASAGKKAARSTRQGLIGAHVSGKVGVLVEVNCESDFVARTDDFQQLVADIGAQVASSQPAVVRKEDGAGQALYEQKYLKDPSLTIEDLIKTKIAKLGENMAVARFVSFELAGPGLVGAYIHHGGQLGVLVEVATEPEAVTGHSEFGELVHDIA